MCKSALGSGGRFDSALFAVLVVAIASAAGAVEPATSAATAPETSSSPAAAAATPSARFHDELVITATSSPEAASDLPYATQVLAADELRRQLARTLPEALRLLPGLAVQKTSQGQGSPFLRGFTGFRTLYLIDGIRLNNSAWREGPNQYATTLDPLAAGRVEVMLGPASVLYGSDAVGGVVQVLSPEVEDAPSSKAAALSGSLLGRFASAERSGLGRLDLSGQPTPRFSYSLGLSRAEFGDLVSGGRAQPKTGYGQRAADGRGVWRFGAHRQLVLGLQTTSVDDAWRTHSTIYGRSFQGTAVGTDRRRVLAQQRSLSYLQWHDEDRRPAWDRLWVSLSYQRQAEREDRVRSNSQRATQQFAVGTLGLLARAEKATRWGDLAWGTELYRDRVESSGRRYDAAGRLTRVEVQGPVADDALYDLFGIYLQDRIATGSRLAWLLGLRGTRARASAGRVLDPATGNAVSLSGSWHETVGNLRALLRLDRADRFQAYAGLSQAFRAPNLSDLTRFDSARSGEREVPSAGLRPERYLTTELGLRGAGAHGSGELAVYRTSIDGLIVRSPTGRLIDGEAEVVKRNAGDGSVVGAELALRGTLRAGWSFSLQGTWLRGEVDGYPTSAPSRVREPMDKMPPPSAALAVAWESSRRPFSAEARLRCAARQDRLSAADRADVQRIPPGGTPGYGVLDLRMGWKRQDKLGLTLAIENATDREYRTHGSGVNEPGRNWVLGIETGF